MPNETNSGFGWRLCSSLALALAVFSSVAHAQSADESQAPRAAASWWDEDVWRNPDRGFNWYPPDKPPKRAKKDAEKPSEKPKKIQEMTKIEDITVELRKLREVAILQPSEQNVLEYMRAQEWVMAQSAMFADQARRVVWKNPEIDGNVKHPQATYAATTKRERTAEQGKVNLLELSKTHGLVFFFRSDCPFCHDMAPVLRRLSDQFGIQVVAVSMDGGPIKQFPNARPDNGISRFVSNGEGVRTVPSLFLVSNLDKSVTPLGAGALAGDEIVERIRVLTTTKPGDEM